MRMSSYDIIIDAAEDVVSTPLMTVVMESGVSHLTLNAVVAKAGVSKGGVAPSFSIEKRPAPNNDRTSDRSLRRSSETSTRAASKRPFT